MELTNYKQFCKQIATFKSFASLVKFLWQKTNDELKTNYTILTEIIPNELSKANINKLIEQTLKLTNDKKFTITFADYLYKAGHCISTLKNNLTLCLDDFLVDEEIINQFNQELAQAKTLIEKDKILQTYLEKAIENLKQKGSRLVHLVESGVRGSKLQLRQMVLARGIIETGYSTVFIPESFVTGLSVKNFELSGASARKSLYNKTVSTYKPGYLTRQMVYCMQHISITEDDCGSQMYLPYYVDEKNFKAFYGKYYLDENKQLQVITEPEKFIGKIIHVRTPLFCKAKVGVCRKCIGEFYYPFKEVGIIAAQTLGERATQLTLRVFHTGSAISLQQELQELQKYSDYLIVDRNTIINKKQCSIVLETGTILTKKDRSLLKDTLIQLQFEDTTIDITLPMNTRILTQTFNNIPENTPLFQIMPTTITNAIELLEKFLSKKIEINSLSELQQYIQIVANLFNYEDVFPQWMIELLSFALLTDVYGKPISVTKDLKLPLIKQPIKTIPHLLGLGLLFETPRKAIQTQILYGISVDSPLKELLYL